MRGVGKVAMLAGALVLGFPHFAGALPPGAAITPADMARLNSFVRQDCGSCHGMTLKGGLGRPLTPEALGDLTPETVRTIILDGIPDTAMPPWRGLLSEAEADWISRALKEGRIR